jgi:hypothetical protein
MSDSICDADRRRRIPAPGKGAGWQESYSLGWTDIETLSAGSHHRCAVNWG